MKLEIRNGVRTGQEIKEILQLRWTRLEPMVREAFYIEARRRKAVFKEVSTRVQEYKSKFQNGRFYLFRSWICTTVMFLF